MVEKIAGADANIQMIPRDVLLLVRYEPSRRALPKEMVGQAEDDEIVRFQNSSAINRLSGRDLFWSGAHVDSGSVLMVSLAIVPAPRSTHRVVGPQL